MASQDLMSKTPSNAFSTTRTTSPERRGFRRCKITQLMRIRPSDPEKEHFEDLRGTLSALNAVGYAGWLIVEQDVRLGVSPIAAPLRDAKRSRAFLTKVLAA